MAAKGHRTLRLAVLVIGCAALAAALLAFLGLRLLSGDKSRPAAPMPKGIDMALGSIDHTATKDGRKHWQLKARTGELHRASARLLLKEVRLVIYLENGEQMTVSADEGALDRVSNDIEVSGRVVVISQGNTLSTAKLNYAHHQQVIAADVPVHLTNGDSWLEADAMVFDLKGNRAQFSGNVHTLLGRQVVF